MSEHGIIHIHHTKAETTPTFICSICETMKDPTATTAWNYAWICPECAKRIKRLIYPADKGE